MKHYWTVAAILVISNGQIGFGREPGDAVAEAAVSKLAASERPEQKLSAHDKSEIFDPGSALKSSSALADQPDEGAAKGFDLSRDPLNAKVPLANPDTIKKADIAAKAAITEAQRRLLEVRYDLTARPHPDAKMSRGKPVPLGPTARLKKDYNWQKLADEPVANVRREGLFPYPSLPHPKQAAGGQVFPAMQIAQFPRLERIDVEFDLPEAFLPEFPPAIFLQNRPELGDVSRGEVISINNFHRLFKHLLTPVQLDGLRLLLTPLPQEEFNATDDRKSDAPSLGVTCFDCHVNGHTGGQFHLNPDTRPQERRMRLDTTSLRGLYNQQIHGSKRSLRSVEDFTEFEQRTAYFNGDASHALKKGAVILDRVQVSHMAQMQNMFDFPPAPRLDPITGRLDPSKASESELRGENVFFGKGTCASCHPAPVYMNQLYHDLKLERFLDEPGDGPMKVTPLRGIKDSPPYLHDGRCLTLEDTVEFFNIVLRTKLTEEEKSDLSNFLRTL